MMRIFGRLTIQLRTFVCWTTHTRWDTVMLSGTAPTTRSQKEFGGRQTEHCCPGLLGGAQRTQMEERLKTVLVLISWKATRLAGGGIGTALMKLTMFVKGVSE